MTDIAPLLEAAVRTAAPLLVASVGENVSERAGVLNIGLEGCIIAGSYAAFALAGAGPGVGYGGAVLAGAAVGGLLVIFSVWRRLDQIIVGTALTMLALGVTGTLFRARGGVTASIGATEHDAVLPIVSRMPVVGHALFAQPLSTYFAFAVMPLVWWWLYRTHAGLALRSVGDSHEAASAAGVRIGWVQGGAALFGSGMAGLAGGMLVLAQAGSFAEGMSAGRGFIAIAIVALGRWRMTGVSLASLGFGLAMALQYVVQALGWHVRYELVLMIPYVVTLGALGTFGRGAAPAMLGRPRPD